MNPTRESIREGWRALLDASGMISLSTQASPNMGKLLTSRRVLAEIDVIVTERSSAARKGKSIAERALALIDLADPPLRQALRDEFFFIGRSDAHHRQ